ncbi:leucine rich adaptor protein 1-like [Pseudorasbora parva]|uniref:leucine rich adaptor protein 1-like n=1 Tax=Pseudorasbora parva TaxID=51549 RepID=UPI00351F01D9
MRKMEELPDFRDVELKLGRKVPESLKRALTGDAADTCTRTGELHTLNNKIRFLRQQMAHLRSIDVTLMHQLLSINEGIESIRWVMEERGGGASREGSLMGSLGSLSDSQEASQHSSCSDGLDGISVGSYLDTLGEAEPEEAFSSTPEAQEEAFQKRPRVEADEYYCFG